MKTKFAVLILAVLMLSACANSKGNASAGLADTAKLEQHIKYMTDDIGIRVVGTEKEKECGDYIIKTLSEYGYSEDKDNLAITPFIANGNASENIIATIPGDDSKILAVVAHYDSMPTTHGAKDNASGTAGLLEIARLLSKETVSPYEIRLIFLGSEENGYHGSAYYANSLSPEDIQKHIAVYNMDISIASKGDGFIPVSTTLGGRENGVYIKGDFLSTAHNAVSKSIETAFHELGYYQPEDEGTLYKAAFHYGESDHVSFDAVGIDSANVCWRNVTVDYAKLPPEYHQMSDLTDNLDYTTLAKTVNGIMKAMEILSRP